MSDLGDMLRTAREKKGLSAAEAAMETRIRGKIIVALEAGDYQHLPPAPFIRGLVKNYARFLGLEPDLVLDAYAIDTGSKPAPFPTPELQPTERPPRSQLLPDLSAEPERRRVFMVPRPAAKRSDPISVAANRATADLPRFLSPSPATSDKVNGSAIQQPVPILTPAPQTVFEVAPESSHEPEVEHRGSLIIARIFFSKLPEAVAVFAVVVAVLGLLAFGYTRFFEAASSVSHIAAEATPAPPTATIAQVTTRLPTPVPTFEGSASGPVQSVPTATKTAAASPASVLPAVPPDAQMDIEISGASPPIWAWVVVDNVEAFKGQIENDTKSWTAHQRLYIQVKDLPNGTVTFEGKSILARVFAERKTLDRAWEIDPAGTPVPVEPLAFLPTPTLVPTNSRTATATNTRSPTPTASTTFTPTESPTLTATFTLTPTLTRTATLTATPEPTATDCSLNPGTQC